MSSAGPVGIVGLGNMGGALATLLVEAGSEVVGHDAAGPARTPNGVRFVPSVHAVARQADVVVFSLPDGRASEQVARQLAGADARRTTHVVDTSTLGMAAAAAIAGLLREAGVGYVDAPVSGGPAGARAGKLALMYAGSDAACAHVEPVLARISGRRYRVGERPGMGQAMKLANNFLSATALAATSEAIAFGVSAGLEMATMLEVLRSSSGQNTAVSDKFPSEVLTGRYAAGFSNSLMWKDLQLYLTAVAERGSPTSIGRTTASVWEQFAAQEPGADFTRIYPFVSGS